MEVMVGGEPEEKEKDDNIMRGFLASFEIIAVTETVAERAIKLRRDKRMKQPDAIILASAIEYGLLFVTRNTKDFDSRWPGVRIPYNIK